MQVLDSDQESCRKRGRGKSIEEIHQRTAQNSKDVLSYIDICAELHAQMGHANVDMYDTTTDS